MIEVSQLYIYPLKGAAGVSVERAEVIDTGFADDRRWMLVDRDGMFMSQRSHPKMVLIRVAARNGLLALDAPGMQRLEVEKPVKRAIIDVTVWSDTVKAICADANANEWLSDFLDEDVRLVYMPDSTFRQVDRDYFANDQQVSFADGFPFLLISQESLDELNRRMESPIEMIRFRHNIVVKGADAPNAEDHWHDMTIGTVRFAGVKPCARCAVPTVDLQTGKFGKEPNRTLATYRRVGSQVYFGQNLVHLDRGVIAIGDAVQLSGSDNRIAAAGSP